MPTSKSVEARNTPPLRQEVSQEKISVGKANVVLEKQSKEMKNIYNLHPFELSARKTQAVRYRQGFFKI